MGPTGRLHHVGVFVDRIDDAVAFLTDTLGLEVVTSFDFSSDRGVKGVFVRWGDVQVEMIEPTNEERRGAALRGTDARIDHLGIEVEDIDETQRQLLSAGVRFTTPQPFVRPTGKVLFTLPESSDGVTYQFTEPAPGTD